MEGDRQRGVRIAGALARSADNPLVQPPQVVLGIDARPTAGRLAMLAAQQLAVQSIYFVLPGVVAMAFGAGPAEAANLLCLSLLGVAVFTLLQGLTRGVVGSGYAMPGIPSPVLLAPYLLAAALGATLDEAAALTLLVGVATVLAVPLFRRLAALI
ncbi:MAG: hypothetical protein K2X74_07040, partial [Acetobacteraceae bacterium]|nr:hypothetical protein [Acetobacteraceae bacterium]